MRSTSSYGQLTGSVRLPIRLRAETDGSLDNQGKAADKHQTVSPSPSCRLHRSALTRHGFPYHLPTPGGETGGSTRRLVPGNQQPHPAPPIEIAAKHAMMNVPHQIEHRRHDNGSIALQCLNTPFHIAWLSVSSTLFSLLHRNCTRLLLHLSQTGCLKEAAIQDVLDCTSCNHKPEQHNANREHLEEISALRTMILGESSSPCRQP
jgi:hypothetical protein